LCRCLIFVFQNHRCYVLILSYSIKMIPRQSISLLFVYVCLFMFVYVCFEFYFFKTLFHSSFMFCLII